MWWASQESDSSNLLMFSIEMFEIQIPFSHCNYQTIKKNCYDEGIIYNFKPFSTGQNCYDEGPFLFLFDILLFIKK